MSDETQSRDAVGIMITKLIMVLLGFMLLLLLLVGTGYLANTYYTSQKGVRDLELLKQEAFTQHMTPRQYLNTALSKEKISQEVYDAYMELLDASTESAAAATVESRAEASDSAMPTFGFITPEDKMFPAPDLTITPHDMADMAGKGALIHTTLGTMVIELYPERAPKSVKNFIYLAKKGFYDGLFFNRIQPGAFMQAGSPTGIRGGNAGYWLDMEGCPLQPLRGTIAMVRSLEGNFTGSEFVIFVMKGSAYEGTVAVFGRIINRFDVAEKIAKTPADNNAYAFERTYITGVDIVDIDPYRPAEDFWTNYGK